MRMHPDRNSWSVPARAMIPQTEKECAMGRREPRKSVTFRCGPPPQLAASRLQLASLHAATAHGLSGLVYRPNSPGSQAGGFFNGLAVLTDDAEAVAGECE